MVEPIVPQKRSLLRTCCLSVLVLLVALTVTIALSAVFAWQRYVEWRSFAIAEHRTWPTPTPHARLATRSPSGSFITRASKHPGDGLSTHSEKHDCIFVAHAACLGNVVEFTVQDRAWCEDSWWACRSNDGRLLHEHFGVKLRWIDGSHLEESWTELVGLDTSGHRVWGRKSAIHRVSIARRAAAGGANPCEQSELQVETLGTR